MTINILYVDDDEGLVRLAQKAFKRDNMEIFHAADPATGLAMLKCGDYALLILDHYLDGTTGIQFIEEIREQQIAVPVIYVTATHEASVAIEALKAGAIDYVIKSTGDDFWPLLKSTVQQALHTSALILAKERADLEILRGKERAEMLLAEVNHRVANSLSLVASLIRLQASSHESEIVKSALSETQARITAVASMHRSLYTSDDISAVAMDRYISSLVSHISSSINTEGTTAHIILDLEPVQLSSDKAVSVGMIVTELTTNAIKYAFPQGRTGKIKVSFRMVSATEAILSVEDDGIGYCEKTSPKGTGLGSKIVFAMAKTLGSGIAYVPVDIGTRAEIRVLLS
jgi:two-component sensor histidine kinase